MMEDQFPLGATSKQTVPRQCWEESSIRKEGVKSTIVSSRLGLVCIKSTQSHTTTQSSPDAPDTAVNSTPGPLGDVSNLAEEALSHREAQPMQSTISVAKEFPCQPAEQALARQTMQVIHVKHCSLVRHVKHCSSVIHVKHCSSDTALDSPLGPERTGQSTQPTTDTRQQLPVLPVPLLPREPGDGGPAHSDSQAGLN